MPKILIVCALFFEAKPFINQLKLKALYTQSSLRVFGNNEYILVVSGTGKVAAAIAVTQVLSQEQFSIQSIWNIGICGSKAHTVGDILLIDSIIDNDTQRTSYLDVFLSSELPVSSLRTLSQSDSQQSFEEAVDMEASGFCEAASFFLPLHKIHALKIVSDLANVSVLEKEKLEIMLKDKTKDCLDFINKEGVSLEEKKTQFIIEKFDELFEEQRLSFTEQKEFEKLFYSLQIQTGKSKEEILKLLSLPKNEENKKRGDMVLKRLKELF